MVTVYLIMFDNGGGAEPLGGYGNLDEAQAILNDMKQDNPDTEYWILEPIEVDPEMRLSE